MSEIQPFDRPYVISWNLTYRCNLACEHCYLDAGGPKHQKVSTANFSDRSELGTTQCFSIIDQIAAFAPDSITILTGGEPLLRKDILEIIRYASVKKLWVVIGTNGVKITESVAQQLKQQGARGMALSLDALTPERHDKFRVVKGSWENTVRGAKILHALDLPFIVQTTVGSHNLDELALLADFAFSELGAKVWNLYFLVQSGRGQFVSDISDDEYESALRTLAMIQQKYLGKMKVNAKCAPHYFRHLFENDRNSPFLKSFVGGAGGCPAGTQYLGIRPNGDVTPCPYIPVFGGNLRNESLQNIWEHAPVFQNIRKRTELGGRCGVCEFNSQCGGCRARAFGVTNDLLAEDPLCSYQPGKYPKESVQIDNWSYGMKADRQLQWDDDARQRLQQIPAFLRGMITKAIEAHCIKAGLNRVTLQAVEELRSRMPTPPTFRAPGGL